MLKLLLRTLWVILQTIIIVVAFLVGIVYCVQRGPSPTARGIFVNSFRETGEMKFVAKMFLSQEEYDSIVNSAQAEEENVFTDTALVVVETPAPTKTETPQPDEWGLIDEDGDGIIICEINGGTYHGAMMVVLDPSRVKVGYIEGEPHNLQDMCEIYGAVAGINAGGYNNRTYVPTDSVVSDGVIYQCSTATAVAALDTYNILHVGKLDRQYLEQNNIRDCGGFGPTLIVNGVETNNSDTSLNPRTAIGQRSDGALLLLVIDGRSVASIGASYRDLTDIMLDYGAVNACNMDGGSSVQMWYEDRYINNAESLVGLRTVASAFLVMPLEDAE